MRPRDVGETFAVAGFAAEGVVVFTEDFELMLDGDRVGVGGIGEEVDSCDWVGGGKRGWRRIWFLGVKGRGSGAVGPGMDMVA